MGKKKYTICLGFLFDYLYENYSSEIFSHVQQACQELNQNFIGLEGGNSRFSTFGLYHQQKNLVIRLIDKYSIDGMILLGEQICNTFTDQEINELCKMLEGIPIVSIGIFDKAVANILIDNETSVHDIVCHLIKAHGRKKIAFLAGPDTSFDSRQRFEAYRNALIDFNIPFEKDMVVSGDYYSRGAKAVSVLLDERHVEFDAIVCANDAMAIYALGELQRRGIRVPDEVAVTGFDNIDECIQIEPPLTTIQQPFHAIGHESVNTLLAAIKGGSVPKNIILPTRAILRESCGCSELTKLDHIMRSTSVDTAGKVKKSDGVTRQKAVQYVKMNLAQHVPEVAAHLYSGETMEPLVTMFLGKSGAAERKNFLEGMKTLLGRLLDQADDYDSVYRFLVVFFSALNEAVMEPGSREVIQSLRNETMILLGLLDRKSRIEHRSQIRQIHNAVIQINDGFADILNLGQLKESMTLLLPKMHVKGLTVCLYADQTKEWARVLLTYHTADQGKTLDKRPFVSKHLVPEKLKGKKNYEHIVAALYFKDEPLGYILFDITGILIEPNYDTLARQIANVVKSAMMTREITDYANHLEQKVRERTIQLELANREKTDFFVNIAHETKTPLTLISNYLESYIKKNGLTDELKVIRDNFGKLLNYMMSYLNMEKIEQGKIVYDHHQTVDLGAIIEGTLSLFQTMAGTKDVRLTTEIATGLYTDIDPKALEHIINNLMDNAIRFTEPGGRVSVRTKAVKNSIVLTVEDTGIGLSSRQQANIFKPYYQGTVGSAGIGMGMHIVKKIIDTIGAKITVEGKQGKGTAICCEFCRSKAAKSEETAATVSAGDGEPDFERDVYLPGRFSILFVEDEPELLTCLLDNARDEFNVFCARHGREALEKLKRIPKPDIIVSDVMMKFMDGFQFFEELRKEQEYRDIPFIFLTVKDTSDARMRGLKGGAIDYIPKPFSVNELMTKIKSIRKMKENLNKKTITDLGGKMYDLLEQLSQGKPIMPPDGSHNSMNSLYAKYGISRKEMEVISLLKLGLEHKEIAGKLDIATNTVRTYIARVYKKCKVNNKIELFRKLNAV